ncbi:3675_t:CDS:2 [Dentiscutata heterogama]|uniref:3675_t:CDS:1 n=1 Tax=Dentiscutata heterogama TaxID=1316150 RepID=A0ACA9KGV7_9GLOM|nr:3675_t:CDS:2 [Dentiscutata heterogama]
MASVLDIDLGENKDHGTGNGMFKMEDVPEETLDILISFVQENNKKLEWLARNKIYAEAGEVAALVEELAELIDEQQEKIARCLFHQQLYENSFFDCNRRVDTAGLAGWINGSFIKHRFYGTDLMTYEYLNQLENQIRSSSGVLYTNLHDDLGKF